MSKLIDKNEQNVIFGNDVLPDNISKGSETPPKTATVTIPDPAEDKVLATSDGVEGEEEPKKKPSWYKRAKASFKADYTEDEEGNRTYIDDCVKPLPEKEEVEKEESGFLKATKKAKNKLDEFTNSCGFKNVKNVIKGVAQYKEMADMGEDRWKAAAVGLSTMLPFQIPEACQNIIDNFASKLSPKHNGYMTNSGTGLIESDEVQCALDALEMMLGIPGLKGKINNFIEDVEATATIIAGMVTTLIDYELLDNLETIFGQCKTLTTLRRAVGMAQNAITASGDIELLWMMTGLAGKISALEYDIKLVINSIRNYRNKGRTYVENAGTPEEVIKTEDERFIEFIEFIDPNWDLVDTGEFVPNEPIYSLEPLIDLSPDAEKALAEHPAIKALVVSNESILEMVDENGSYLLGSGDNGVIRTSVKKIRDIPLTGRGYPLFDGNSRGTVSVIDRYNNIVAKEKFDDKSKPKINLKITKDPTVADVTRFMYPNATGSGIRGALPMSDPLYFYV